MTTIKLFSQSSINSTQSAREGKEVKQSTKTNEIQSPKTIQQHGRPVSELLQGNTNIAVSLQNILKRSSTTLGAVGQLFESTVEQARTDKKVGKGTLEGATDFSKIVRGLQSEFKTRATASGYSAAQQKSMTLDDIGAVAGSATREIIRGSMTDAAAGSFGIKPETLGESSLLDLTLYNLGLGSPDKLGAATASNVGSAAMNTASGAAAGGMATNISTHALGFVGAAYSGFQLFQNWGKGDPIGGAINGFTTGAYIGTMFGGGIGAAIGGAIGGLVGLASGILGRSGKSADQRARDQVRNLLREHGVVNGDWQLMLADGSGYDIGKDGKHKLQNLDGTQRRAYEIDLNNPRAGEAIGMLQPLAFLLTGGNKKLTTDFTGYFVNAALSNAKTPEEVRANALSIFKSTKATPEQLVKGIAAAAQQGILAKDTAEAYLNGVMNLFQSVSEARAQGDTDKKQGQSVKTKAKT
jgi:hypothetical protein